MKFSATVACAMLVSLQAASGQEVIFGMDESGSMGDGVISDVRHNVNTIFTERTGSRIGLGGYGTHPRGPPRNEAAAHVHIALVDDPSAFELATDKSVAASGSVARERGYELVIKPGNCPRPINMREGGAVLPAAIVGNEKFDVKSIDADSILLEDACAPVKWNYEDVVTPYEDGFIEVPLASDCTRDRSDGHEDLFLKFDRACVYKVMGPLTGTDARLIKVTGKYDKHGEAHGFEAYDIVRLMNKGKKNLRK